ncbi:MAG TPA: hypothetical protein VFJ24_00390 [Gaiellales bacterium]|nr:hypothetical protein [Gaiellales bacterium]
MRIVAAALLVVWEPLALAISASGWIQVLLDRGAGAVAFLILRMVITGMGMTAGSRLWQGQPGGIVLARWTYALQLGATVAAYSTRLWPTTLPPGVREPAFVLGLAWYAAWLTWSLLVRSDRT